MTGKSHGESRDEGVNSLFIRRYKYAMRTLEDRENIKSQYAGAGYTTKQGVVHLNVEDDAPPLKTMTEEQSDAYIVGVIFAQHFSLKKGLELFGEKVETAVHKELE